MAQQFALQQQLSNAHAAEGVNPMQMPPMMGGFPMMPNMGMPGMMPPSADGAGQMHMPMMPMMPMGMQFPYPQAPTNQFSSQGNKDKK